MTERLLIDSSVIAIPIGVRDKEDPEKVHDYTLHYDISDSAVKDLKSRQAVTDKALADIRAKYNAVLGDDGEVTDDNLSDAIAGIGEVMRAQFDADYGTGEYDKVVELGGGNSVINMMDLYQQVNDFVGARLDQKFEKLNKQSANRQAKYFKKHGKK
ncbi:hypothetical protein [Lacticaseibacillus absianus]|uniref:hypothetical protein n=1 Tax=Lacticaseibacillus absianus TaxID=2729623 RepID=UPI0015C77FF6|nr:hypothetical protein [Lacticaseibacillus absianus]